MARAIVTAEDVKSLHGEKIQLAVRAALAAGYKVDVRMVHWEALVYANGKHWFPFGNWLQCVGLIRDTHSHFEISQAGEIYTSINEDGFLPHATERRTPTDLGMYQIEMCDAVVRNVAKGFPV